MKTVFKSFVVFLAIGLFTFCLFTIPKRAKAVDNNTPMESEGYNFTYINIPTDFYFMTSTGSPIYYYPAFFRIQIYNTTQIETDGASTVDQLYYLKNASSTGSAYLNMSNGDFSPAFIYQSSTGTSSPQFQTRGISYKRETSAEISGTITSYVIDSVSIDNALHLDNGFSVTFNFEVGYKKYTFYSVSLSCVFYSVTLNPLPRTYSLNVVSGDNVAIYQTARQEGYNEGYNSGFDAGQSAGQKSGYTIGYNAGYNDGRTAPEYSFKEFFVGLGDAFVTIWTGMLNFEFLGVNIAGLIGTILVVCLVVFIVKLVKGA